MHGREPGLGVAVRAFAIERGAARWAAIGGGMTDRSQSDPAGVLGRVVELAHVGLGIADATGTITYANPRLAEILGRPDPVGLTLDELGLGHGLGVGDAPRSTPNSDDDDGPAYRLAPGPDERLIQRPNGRRAWTLIERSGLTGEPARPTAFVFTVSDIDALKRAQADALSRGERLADFAQCAGVGVCRIDLDLRIIVEANDAIATIYGYQPGELLGAHPGVLAGLDEPGNAGSAGRETLAERLVEGRLSTSEGERVVTRRDGQPVRVRVALARSPGADGRLGYLTAIVQDVTEQHAEAERIRHQALHDSLTGLANRTRFAQLVADAAARPESQRGHVAVLFLDIDHFKLVNDSLGHLAGDELLRAVAQRFNLAVHEPETVIRFGGDEFVVFCTGIYRVEDAEEVARRLLNALQTPFTVGGRHVFVTASVGISLSAEPHAERMLSEADAAMYRAKALGPDRIAVFDPTLHDRSSRDLQLAAQMHEALAEEQFVLEYQPIVELATGRIAGLEALVRWEHPTEGRLPPSEFVLIAQRTGMIVPLGGWILRRACGDARVWQQTHPDVAVHVNLSPSQLVDTLPDEVGAALEASGLTPERLVLEVTEGAMIPDPAEVDVPTALRGLGVTMALDDFGTGYSSLAFLDRLPLDELKIDRQFVARLAKTDAGRALVSAILQLARTFGLRAVAEGIETETQLKALLDLGCEFGQGFHFSRPVGTDRVAGLLATQRRG
jgi:diguanylate cyclase (GGDEF)-like protein/PAS domain S-box-containing protein